MYSTKLLLKLSNLSALMICMATAVSCEKPNELDSGTTPPSHSPLNSVPLVPAEGALLGHYYGNGTISATDAMIGAHPEIHLTYFDWKDHWATEESIKEDFSAGRIPLVNWEPNDINFADIVSGKYDEQIRQQADEAKSLKKQFFLDFAAEMNEEEGWGGHKPELYINAYRHIHDLFIQRGAINAIWVWCPNNIDSEGQPEAMRYYPGDSYVDWVGADGYNWGTSTQDHEWESFYDVFKNIYSKITVTGKPMIIGEMGADEAGGEKADWINSIIPNLKTRFPAIKAVVWFDVDKERHWQINSSQRSLAAYRILAKDPYFNIK